MKYFVTALVFSAVSIAQTETPVKSFPQEDQARFDRVLRLAEGKASLTACVAEAKELGTPVAKSYSYTVGGKLSRSFEYDLVKDGKTVGTLILKGRPGLVKKNLVIADCEVIKQ